MKNKKIALCLAGLGDSTRHGILYQKSYLKAFKYYNEDIIGKYDTDVFIHSFSEQYKSEMINLYNPKLHCIQPQIDFAPLHKRLDPNGICEIKGTPNLYSMFYSRKSVTNMMLAYSDAYDIDYDFVILSRNDFEPWHERIKFNPLLDNNLIYCRKFDQSNGGTRDEWFYMNKENAFIIGSLFDYLPKYLSCSPTNNPLFLSCYMSALATGWPVSSPNRFSCELYKPENERSKVLETMDLKTAWNSHYLYKYHLYLYDLWNLHNLKELD